MPAFGNQCGNQRSFYCGLRVKCDCWGGCSSCFPWHFLAWKCAHHKPETEMIWSAWRAAAPEPGRRAMVMAAGLTGTLSACLVHGAAGTVASLGGQPVAVTGLTVRRGKVTEIDIIADPDRLLQLDLAVLGG